MAILPVCGHECTAVPKGSETESRVGVVLLLVDEERDGVDGVVRSG